MTIIAILNGDYEILMDDETVGANAVAGLKTVRRAAAASATKYTTNQVYSAIADAADDFQAMGFENPMLPVTPNAYTMENDYFIPRSTTENMSEGAVSADWTGNIRSIVYTPTVIDFVAGDIGRQLVGGTTNNTGTLLDFEVLPDGSLLLWVRPDDPIVDTFANLSETLSVTADGGVGNCSALASSSTGISLYSSIQVIGSVPTATEVYVIQERQKMTDSQGAFQWWATDPGVSLGIIDILIRVKRDGVLIADGDVEVFGRRYTSLYDNFRLNVAAGGRSALPLASAPDINNTTGYRQLTGSAGVGVFNVGNLIYAGVTFSTATKKGVITAVSGTTAAPVIEYYTVGDLTDFANLDSVKEYDTINSVDGDATCTAAAPIANPGGPTDVSPGNGGTVVITSGATTVDHDGDAVAEPYSITVDAQGNVPAAKVYERLKFVVRRGATAAELFGATVNIPGETYRGLEAQAQYGVAVGILAEGNDLIIAAKPGYTARVISINATDTYLMLASQETSVNPLTNNDVLVDEGANTVTVLGAPTQFTSPKGSPLGTFTGTQIFGARGTVYVNPHPSDTQNYLLTDDNGFQRTPPNTVSYVVNNTAAGDRVLVARDTGISGIINKDQFGGLDLPATTYNGLGDFEVRVAGSIDTEVPTTGFVRVVSTGLQEEHHYVYSGRTTGLNGVFTLKDPTPATPSISTASTGQLIDISATFTTGQTVEVGMLVRNTTATKTTHVWEVTNVVDANTLDLVQLYGPLDVTQDWDLNDTYTINSLIGNHTTPGDYSVTDNVFDLLIDEEATGTTTSNSFVKVVGADFNTVVNVRQGKIILPFTQNQTVGDSGAGVTVVRTPDTIAI